MKLATSLLPLALAATLGLAGCGAPGTSLSGSESGAYGAFGGGRAWSYVSLVAHDNNLQSASGTYVSSTSAGARMSGVAPVTYIDDNGADDSIRMYPGANVMTKEKLPELDSASAKTVGNILSFADQVAAAPRKVLVMADHGGGIVRGICSDEHGNAAHIIPVADLGNTLRQQPVEILYFDACFMQMIEVAAQVQGGAKVILASESETYAGTAPHAEFMKVLSDGGAAARTDDVAAKIVKAGTSMAAYDSSFSAVRVDAAANLMGPMNKLSDKLVAAMKANPQLKTMLKSKIGEATAFLHTDETRLKLYNSFRDMGDTLDKIAAAVGGDIAADAKAIAAQLDKEVVIAHTEDRQFGKASGLVLYAPVDGNVAESYLKSEFHKKTNWGHFLAALNSGAGWANPVQPDKYPNGFPSGTRR